MVSFDVEVVCDPILVFDWETGQDVPRSDLLINGSAR